MGKSVTPNNSGEYPDVNVMVDGSKWGRILTVGAVGIAGLGIAAGFLVLDSGDNKDRNSSTTTTTPDEYRAFEAQDNNYSMRSTPFNAQKDTAFVIGLEKDRNPVEPVCFEESATLVVDSYIAEAYIKGLGHPAVGYISSIEFPAIESASVPECTEEDFARMNVAEIYLSE